MKGRLPTVLSVTAILIAVAAATPVGQAARDAIVPKARFALNSDRVDGIHASRVPKAGRLLPLGTNKKFPASALSALNGLEVVSVASAQDSSSPKVVAVNCPAGKRVVGGGGRATGTPASNGNIAIIELYPTSVSQWTIRAVEIAATGSSWTLTGHAFCAAGS
jgi:hypothetical protein